MSEFFGVIIVATIFFLIFKNKKGKNTTVESKTNLLTSSIAIFAPPPIKQSFYIEPKDPITPFSCPYCGVVMDDAPKIKRRCKSCKQTMFVGYGPDDNGKQKRILTADEKRSVNEEWDSRHLHENLSAQLEEFGISLSDFESHQEKTGKSDRDAFWSLCNKKISQYTKKSDFRNLGRIYFVMSNYLYDNGQDGNKLLSESMKMELMSYSDSEEVSISAGRCCEACSELDGKTLQFKKAVESNPLPNPKCTKLHYNSQYAECNCSYNPHFTLN